MLNCVQLESVFRAYAAAKEGFRTCRDTVGEEGRALVQTEVGDGTEGRDPGQDLAGGEGRREVGQQETASCIKHTNIYQYSVLYQSNGARSPRPALLSPAKVPTVVPRDPESSLCPRSLP